MSEIQIEALRKFQALNDLFNRDVPETDLYSEFISGEKLLEWEKVIVPIAAVTEAIKWGPEDMKMPFFDVTSEQRIRLAKTGKTDYANYFYVSSLRPGKPLLIPWVYNFEEVVATAFKSGDAGLHKKIANADKKLRSHIFLLLISVNRGHCEIRIYDSKRMWFRDNPIVWSLVLSSIRTVIRNMEWFPHDAANEAHAAACDGLHALQDPRFGPEVEVQVAEQQEGGWQCGVHTILNAWTVAMNLLPNPRFQHNPENPKDFYNLAINTINLVVAGLANSDLIYTFLVGYAYALPSKTRDQCPSFGRLDDIHRISSISDLDEHINEAHQNALDGFEQNTPPGPGNSDNKGKAPAHPAGIRGSGPSTAQVRGQLHQQQLPASNPKVLIDPAVLALPEFADADALTFWEKLTQSPKNAHLIDQTKMASEASSGLFVQYIVHCLDPEGSKQMTMAQKIGFWNDQRRRLERALTYLVSNALDSSPMAMNLLRAQNTVYQLMFSRIVVPMKVRANLIKIFEAHMRHVNQTQARLPSNTLIDRRQTTTQTAQPASNEHRTSLPRPTHGTVAPLQTQHPTGQMSPVLGHNTNGLSEEQLSPKGTGGGEPASSISGGRPGAGLGSPYDWFKGNKNDY